MFLNAKYIALAAIFVSSIAIVAYVRHLQSSVELAQSDLRDAQTSVETYKISAERAVKDAEALIASRDAAADSYRTSLEMISASKDACLDERIPSELID